MSQVKPPFTQYFDLNGTPLNNGYIYVGLPNLNPETNQIIVYWDEAGTLPAAQPLRTINGYIARNGSPSSIYINSLDCSMTIKDRNGNLVSYNPLISGFAGTEGLQIINTYATLRSTNPSSGHRIRVGYGYTPRDGASGDFYGVTGAAAGTYVDNGGTIIVPTGGDGSSAWLRDFDGRVNVRHFGAAGNGTTDDTAAIHLAITYMRTLVHMIPGDTVATTFNQAYSIVLYFPPGEYLTTSPINLTGIRDSHAWWYVDARGAIFYPRATGKTAFDLTYSRKCSWLGGTIIGDDSYLLRSGIQIGRNSTGSASDSHHFQDLEVKGYFSLACIYNYASEDALFEHVALKNDYNNANSYCLVQDGEHIFGIQSDFQTPAALNTPASFLRNTFLRFDARKTTDGSAVWSCASNTHSYLSSYLVSDNQAGIVLYTGASLNGNNQLTLDLHIETDKGDTNPATGVKYSILFDASGAARMPNINGMKYRDNYSHAQLAFFATTAAVTQVDILNIDFEVNRIQRDVGQKLFDVPSKYRVSGDLAVYDDDLDIDITGLQAFSGRFTTGSLPTMGKTDTGSHMYQSINKTGFKNSVNVMVRSSNVADFAVVDYSGNSLAKITYDAINLRWYVYCADAVTPTYNLSAASINPITDISSNIGSLTARFLTGFFQYARPGDGTVRWSARAGSSEGVVTDVVGSLRTNTSGGIGTTLQIKESGTGNTGWKTYQAGSVSADYGDAAATLTPGTSEKTNVWNTPLTVNRAVTLSTTGAYNGLKYRIVRTAASTGAFTLDVGTGPLKSLAVGTWCDVEYNGTAWFLTAYGAL